jgi:flavodoxin
MSHNHLGGWNMKTLVAYYSRTGVTRKAAEDIARWLGADIEEIIDAKPRGGVIGWLGAGKDASLKRLAEIAPVGRDPAAYELVVVGTPVWAFTMAPAVRTYITRYGQALKRVAFFCTMGGSGDKRTFRHMAGLTGSAPLATLALIEKDVREDRCGRQIEGFVARLKGGGA